MKKKTKIKLIFTLAVLLLLALIIYTVECFKNNFPEAATRYCDRVIVAQMSEMLNLTLLESISKEDTTDILDIRRDNTGNVELITVNTDKVNLLKSRLTLQILDTMKNKDTMNFGIPLGNVLGSYIFSGLGPDIPITIVPVGSVVSKTKSSFVSGGVNQTKYELYVEFILCIEVVGPFISEAREITGQLCVAQTIIVGESPGVIWSGDN